MKQVIASLFFMIMPVLLIAQLPDSTTTTTDSLSISRDTGQLTDSAQAILARDSSLDVKRKAADSILLQRDIFSKKMKDLILRNQLLNWKAQPIAQVVKLKSQESSDRFFYILLAITAMLGFFRFFYTRYFNNLFRVFFNASLRQSQLTDQLIQAKLPSMFFNILFLITGGVYIYLLLAYYKWIPPGNFWKVSLYCFISLTAIYIGKFMSLKFTGWLTGYKEITNTYVFIIFLINKILGILLLPFTIIIAFSTPSLVTSAVILSLLLIGLMFLLRFFRSYGLLQHQLKIKKFHFFMYVVGIEIIPLLLIYKGLVLLLSKNL